MTWTRRRFLTASGAAAVAAAWRAPARAQAPKPITVSHSVSTFVYGQHLVAREKKFFEEEGVAVPFFIAPGGGAKVAQVLAAGQAMFALGDSNHPLKITEKGKDALMVFATDTRCSYANVVVRKELFDRDEKAWTRVFGGPIPATVGFTLRETIEKSPDLVQGYVSACYRAQQWIHRAKDEEIVELLYKPYMDTYSRDNVLRSVKYYKTIFDWDFVVDEKSYENGTKVWVPLAVDKPVPYAKAVEMAFVKKARAKYKS